MLAIVLIPHLPLIFQYQTIKIIKLVKNIPDILQLFYKKIV